VSGVAFALVATGGAALAQVPPPGAVPPPPPVPPASLPSEADPVGEAASVPAAFACSIPGAVVTILRFGAVAAGLTGQVDVDAASPWFGPLYSACLAFPSPVAPTECEVDRTLRANGYGSNGLPITLYLPAPNGMVVTPLDVAEREIAARAGPLPASPAATQSEPLGRETLEPSGSARGEPLPAATLPGSGAAPARITPTGSASSASGSTSVGGRAGGGVARTQDLVAGTLGAPISAGSSSGDALGTQPLAATAAPATGRTYHQNLVAGLAAVAGMITLLGMALARREAARAASPGS
jgi:hypothetical protein